MINQVSHTDDALNLILMTSKKYNIENGINIEPVKVLLVGAGRGPLIIRALNASRSCGIPIKLTAVEK